MVQNPCCVHKTTSLFIIGLYISVPSPKVKNCPRGTETQHAVLSKLSDPDSVALGFGAALQGDLGRIFGERSNFKTNLQAPVYANILKYLFNLFAQICKCANAW